MAQYARTVWLQARGTLLALLGVAAAYGLSLPLHTAGAGFVWQAGLGLAAFLTVTTVVGRYGFRMHAMDAVEETADAVRVFALTLGRITLTFIPVLAALLGQNPRHI
ncbi:hypothetical protein [Streptomyces sp. NBC_00878]|uniref:hypothetical protein n=1 Tax=Streptomyces sp. NBC_00878 TaxID=2975854 RepID=UPI002256FCB3|nr:hypothetical protein [Streptomyces sp. NBC_00878]MCX4911871.1 hypothetical protein [Streptomyces sp. NBC_00878]